MLGGRIARLEGGVSELGIDLHARIQRMEEQLAHETGKLGNQIDTKFSSLSGRIDELKARLGEEAERSRAIEAGLSAAGRAADELRSKIDRCLGQQHWEDMGKLLESRLGGQDAKIDSLLRKLDSGLSDTSIRCEELHNRLESGIGSCTSQVGDLNAALQRNVERLDSSLSGLRVCAHSPCRSHLQHALA